MIENERQYRITTERVREFEQALAQLRQRPLEERPKHPRLRQAQEDSLLSMLEELREQVARYEAAQAVPPKLSAA